MFIDTFGKEAAQNTSKEGKMAEADYAGAERRRHKRVKVSFILNYSCGAGANSGMIPLGQQVDAMMLDLCEGGVAILTNQDLPLSSSLGMKFTLMNYKSFNKDDRTKIIEARGKVCYSNFLGRQGYRVGVAFTSISDSDRSAISEFVDFS